VNNFSPKTILLISETPTKVIKMKKLTLSLIYLVYLVFLQGCLEVEFAFNTNGSALGVLNYCGGPAIQSCALGGSGEVGNPYLIGDVNCLQQMSDGLDCHYRLNNNIDASSTTTWNAGNGWMPVGIFTGTLDGANFTISGLKCTNAKPGLFYRMGGNATVRNLVIDSFDIDTGAWNGGTLVSEIIDGSILIDNIDVNNSVVTGGSFNDGGLIGVIADGPASVAVSNVQVNNLNITAGSFNAGGIIGVVTNITGGFSLINSQVNNSNLIGGGFNVGGLIGEISNLTAATINNSNVTNTSLTGGSFNTGGLVGVVANLTSVSISNSSVVNSILVGGGFNTGGLIGESSVGSQVLTLSTVSVSDTNITTGSWYSGGIIGVLMNGPSLNLNGADIQNVTISSQAGGVAGYLGVSSTATVQNLNLDTFTISGGQRGYVLGIFDNGSTLNYYSGSVMTSNLTPALMPAFGSQAGGATLNLL
jgi:trimeric autotransporter adhesin